MAVVRKLIGGDERSYASDFKSYPSGNEADSALDLDRINSETFET
jgi:hypothetical protein